MVWRTSFHPDTITLSRLMEAHPPDHMHTSCCTTDCCVSNSSYPTYRHETLWTQVMYSLVIFALVEQPTNLVDPRLACVTLHPAFFYFIVILLLLQLRFLHVAKLHEATHNSRCVSMHNKHL